MFESAVRHSTLNVGEAPFSSFFEVRSDVIVVVIVMKLW